VHEYNAKRGEWSKLRPGACAEVDTLLVAVIHNMADGEIGRGNPDPETLGVLKQLATQAGNVKLAQMLQEEIYSRQSSSLAQRIKDAVLTDLTSHVDVASLLEAYRAVKHEGILDETKSHLQDARDLVLKFIACQAVADGTAYVALTEAFDLATHFEKDVELKNSNPEIASIDTKNVKAVCDFAKLLLNVRATYVARTSETDETKHEASSGLMELTLGRPAVEPV
jgi:hypothetical protein